MLALNAAINPVINSNIGNPLYRPRHQDRIKARCFRLVSWRPGNGFVAQPLRMGLSARLAVTCALAPIGRYLTPANSGLTSGLPRVMAGLLKKDAAD
jgi:hypothetical protein